MAQLDELKRLGPKERLAKLKELEEARKREITEARDMLTDTVRELEAEDEEKAKIPIDQLKVMDESALVSQEERELFRIKRFGAGQRKVAEEGGQEKAEDVAARFETTEERHERLEQLVAGARRMAEGEAKQYGSPLSTVLDEMREKYLNPQRVVKSTAEILQNTAYDRNLSDEEKWKTYGDAKSVVARLEQTGAPSEEIKYAANAIQKFVDTMKMHYRT